MADEALARCVATLSAVFIFGGDITRAEDREHQRPGQYGPIDPFIGVTPSFPLSAFLHQTTQISGTHISISCIMILLWRKPWFRVGQLWAGHAPKSGGPYTGFLDPLEDR
jgi:hypothetical protein